MEITPIQVRYKEAEFTTDELAEAIGSVAFLDEPIFEEAKMPLQSQVVDKLADMLFASDMVLDILRDERHPVPPHLLAVEPQVRDSGRPLFIEPWRVLL
jgi:hypothetical protein